MTENRNPLYPEPPVSGASGASPVPPAGYRDPSAPLPPTGEPVQASVPSGASEQAAFETAAPQHAATEAAPAPAAGAASPTAPLPASAAQIATASQAGSEPVASDAARTAPVPPAGGFVPSAAARAAASGPAGAAGAASGAAAAGASFGAASGPARPSSFASAPHAARTAVPQPKDPQARRTFLTAFGGAALACVIAFAGFAGVNTLAGHTATGSVVLGSSAPVAATTSDDSGDRAETVASQVLPSVAGISVYQSASSRGFINSFSQGGSSSLVETGQGSGVVISADGYILTNNHVVEGADKVEVSVGGETLEAKVVGTDPTTDLAVVKVDAQGLTPIAIGDSDAIKPGQWVMTAGSPFGLEQSVATGIISATSRTVTVSDSSSGTSSQSVSVYSNMIQTDAAINPGNSGGALVDENGRLLGINSVIESPSGSYSGVGFAIPVNYAMNIAQQIIDGKTPTHAQMGVSPVTLNSQTATRLRLDGVSKGAYLNYVYPGSGAEAAGLQEGDVITKVDGKSVESATDLIAAVRQNDPGDKVEVTYVRDGQTESVQVTLGSDEE